MLVIWVVESPVQLPSGECRVTDSMSERSIALTHLVRHYYNLLMSKPKTITSDRVKEVLLADDVKLKSISPYLAAWRWAESCKTTTGLSAKTVKTYKADAHRVYQLLGQTPPK